METNETKIERVLKTPSIFNFARQNHPRFDDTFKEVWNIAEHPPKRSLAPINALCEQLSNRHQTFEEVWKKASNYSGYLRMAADEIIPVFDNFLTQRQIEVVPDFVTKPYRYPFARREDGTVRAIPMQPTFVAIEKDRLVPYFALLWANPKFKFSQIQLICSIIADGVLSVQDYSGSDAKIVLVRRGKWENSRSAEVLRVRDYATLSQQQINQQFAVYNRAIEAVLARLTS